ncbi:MAG: hypothetical protein K2Q18_11885 [Bdellovibrionales bacterium]|nr:hypothetical protein [Bdellovibrionales bacterium]
MKLLSALLLMVISSSALADMVFMREWDGNKHIVYKTSEGVETQITSGNLVHLYPDISPDGKNIVYVEGTISEAGVQDLYLITKNLVTNKTEKWLSSETKGMILHPKFSKNGQFIFFSAPSPKNKVFYFEPNKFRLTNKYKSDVTIQNYSPTVLNKDDEGYFPRPSSDGNVVVYQKNTNGVREVVLVDRIEESKTVIDQGMAPSLSFDERLIAYTSKKAGSWDIYEYNRDTKKTTRIKVFIKNFIKN